jgi:hypothetical protein
MLVYKSPIIPQQSGKDVENQWLKFQLHESVPLAVPKRIGDYEKSSEDSYSLGIRCGRVIAGATRLLI